MAINKDNRVINMGTAATLPVASKVEAKDTPEMEGATPVAAITATGKAVALPTRERVMAASVHPVPKMVYPRLRGSHFLDWASLSRGDSHFSCSGGRCRNFITWVSVEGREEGSFFPSGESGFHFGVVKSYQSAKNYGFIACEEISTKFKRDTYLAQQQVVELLNSVPRMTDMLGLHNNDPTKPPNPKLANTNGISSSGAHKRAPPRVAWVDGIF